MKISVLLAAYNGEMYISEQISSILPQLGEDDELIISDDSPNGNTLAAVESFLADGRVKYVKGPQKGVDANKEFLFGVCTGDVAFLCDQDDVWLPDKVEKVMAQINSGAGCVLHNAYLTDADLNKTGQTLFGTRNAGKGIIRNILKNCYTGSCMALTRQAFTVALPFPKDIPMHDQWLGLVCEKTVKTVLLDEPLILWRRNEGSMTGGRTSLAQKIKWRIAIVKNIITYSNR
ncbi:MAG: glycosyltransferase [Clostridia bacterium]|nr:glycosyltransferase [Clostridia bacterium]